jgi:hypothetical protein
MASEPVAKDSIEKDIEWYKYLCEKYGEEPVLDELGIDPYSDHSYELQDRFTEEKAQW